MRRSVYGLIRKIRGQVNRLGHLGDHELRQAGLELKYQAMLGKPLETLIPEGFALVVESTRRCLGLRHYDVQLECGIYLVQGKIAEMKTGEGKTLTASLPVFLHALSGRGAHVATVNDYLANRDWELLEPVFSTLGLSSGAITETSNPRQRFEAYRKDITYGCAKQFGFDFLRDRLKRIELGESGQPVAPELLTQRPLNFVLVDEADSILIDEARTPLIIGIVDRAEESVRRDCFYWASEAANQFQEELDFSVDPMLKRVELTFAGRTRLRQLSQNGGTRSVSMHDLYHYMETAIKVRRDFHLDKNYAIREGKIVIIDEFTGRIADGRKWQDGIHQSLEAKERLQITPATKQAARVTVQNFFRRYHHLAGMTGTAWPSRKELKKVYEKSVARVPTHRPVQREEWPVKIFGNRNAKLESMASEVETVLKQGRAVLVGCRTVEQSEHLSRVFNERGIFHEVLNARNPDQEADIVKRAGQPQAVTVATNMAGRGTDIKLHDDVRQNGGLHVLVTEIHESARIDWQLIGRGSRQGDPGSFRVFAAMDDEILKLGLGPTKANRLFNKYGHRASIERTCFRFHRLAQRKAEHRHRIDRMVLMKQEKDRQEFLFETGQDPFLDVVE